MIRINHKPLSVNDAWKGRKFKTANYTKYERDILYMLPRLKIPSPPYHLDLEFGMSKLSDIDNPVKNFIDILQKKYKFNDRDIMELHVKKTIVKKGNEFIAFELSEKTYA